MMHYDSELHKKELDFLHVDQNKKTAHEKKIGFYLESILSKNKDFFSFYDYEELLT